MSRDSISLSDDEMAKQVIEAVKEGCFIEATPDDSFSALLARDEVKAAIASRKEDKQG